jgi:hypothetical protein
MLRHLYAAGTPHKNAATPFLEEERMGKVSIVRSAAGVFSLIPPGEVFCDFLKWGTRHFKKSQNIFLLFLSPSPLRVSSEAGGKSSYALKGAK